MFAMTVTRVDRTAAAKARLLARSQLRARRAAEFALERARAHVPIDTGRLRASLHVAPGIDAGSWRVAAGTPYAAAVEFGSVARGRHVPPNPYLRRAILDAQRAYPDLRWGPVVRSGGGGGGG